MPEIPIGLNILGLILGVACCYQGSPRIGWFTIGINIVAICAGLLRMLP